MNGTDGALTPPEKEEVKILAGESEIITGNFHGHHGSNDYSMFGVLIEAIVDSSGTELEGTWRPEWTEIAPGIETREQHFRIREVRIHRRACPVRVRMRSYHEYNSYTDWEHCSHSSTTYWVRVQI